MSKELTIHKIPTLNELYDDKLEIIKQGKLNIILNQEPKADWIKAHPFVKNLKYLPVERVEYLLTAIFGKWRVEVKEIKIIANSIVTTVRLHVKDPISGEWDYQDGIGATPIQVTKGSGATEFDKMNSSAVQIGAPASESYAVKDAAEKFGKIFGKDLNRKDNIAYTDRIQNAIEASQKMLIIENIQNTDDLPRLWISLSQKERDDADILQAYQEKKGDKAVQILSDEEMAKL
jgi:hypothetical protein